MIEKLICKFLIRRLKKGYGADCNTYDLFDSDNIPKDKVISNGRCFSCRAEEAIAFLEEHVRL